MDCSSYECLGFVLKLYPKDKFGSMLLIASFSIDKSKLNYHFCRNPQSESIFANNLMPFLLRPNLKLNTTSFAEKEQSEYRHSIKQLCSSKFMRFIQIFKRNHQTREIRPFDQLIHISVHSAQ